MASNPAIIRRIAEFHHETSHLTGKLLSPIPGQPIPGAGSRIKLPGPSLRDLPSFGEVIQKRRSIRAFAERPLSEQQLAELLYLTYGKTRTEHHFLHKFTYRTAPSAGALYPIELLVRINNVEKIKPGLYLYLSEQHSLRRWEENTEVALGRALLDQLFAAEAPVLLILTAATGKIVLKYGLRSYRYIFLDAGHIAQNAYLAATALGLGACEIGAFYDDLLSRYCGLDGEENFPVVCVAVGFAQEGQS